MMLNNIALVSDQREIKVFKSPPLIAVQHGCVYLHRVESCCKFLSKPDTVILAKIMLDVAGSEAEKITHIRRSDSL